MVQQGKEQNAYNLGTGREVKLFLFSDHKMIGVENPTVDTRKKKFLNLKLINRFSGLVRYKTNI